jgi:hypothetical protein
MKLNIVKTVMDSIEIVCNVLMMEFDENAEKNVVE